MSEVSNSRLDALNEVLALISKDLNLPLLQTLILVARNEGLSVNELAEKLNAPQQTASRYVAILQGRYETPDDASDGFAKNPFLSLEISNEDPRRRALFLTSHGENKLTTIIKKIYE